MKKTSNGATAYRMREAMAEAGVENKEEKEREKALGAGERTQKKSLLARAFFSLDFKPVSFDEDVSSRCDLIRFSNGIYISFTKPYRRQFNTYSKKIFILYCNDASVREFMADKRARMFLSYDDFLERCKENKFLAFLRDCSTISRGIFDDAKANPNTTFCLTVDNEKYKAKVGQPTCFNVLEDRI